MVLAAAPLFAQPPLEGKPIVAVRVSGLVHVKETVVVAQIESVPGRPYQQVTADQESCGWMGWACSVKSR